MTALPGPDLHAKSFNGEFAIAYGIYYSVHVVLKID